MHTPFWALYRQEMREVLTVPTYATNCLTGVVMFPVLLVVMAVGIGRETDGMALSEVVAQFVPKSVYLAVAAGFLALTCTMDWPCPPPCRVKARGMTCGASIRLRGACSLGPNC